MKKKELMNLMNKRTYIIISIILAIFLLTIIQLFRITVIKRNFYTKSLKELSQTIVYKDSSPRGRIYDRNYNLLVDNVAIPVIYYKKPDKVTTKKELELSYKIVQNIDIDSSKIALRNLKEFYEVKYSSLVNNKITDSEWEDYENRKLSDTDIYNLKLDRITDEELEKLSEEDVDAAYVFFLMNNGYSYAEKIIKKDNLSEEEYAYIAEHKEDLPGFDVKYTWERYYPYGDTFRSILGNIASISYEEKNYYLSLGYSLNEIVGSSYIEKQYESLLRGQREKYVITNGVESLLEEGSRGHDIVLTIDINLQQEVEKILEEQVVYTKSEPSTDYYNHSFVVIQEPNTGEILAMSGKQAIYKDGKYEVYDYTPNIVTSPIAVGSVVKGASMIVGYNNNIIDIGATKLDECIKLYSIPRKCSSATLGTINDITALAYSSNVYQFKIAMELAGINYYYGTKDKANSEALDIYRNTFNEFGLGVKTGIDLPIESIGNVGNKNTTDLLLNFSIGQYDTYTTMQLSQYITTIASNGNRYAPRLLKEVYHPSNTDELGKLYYKVEPELLNKVNTEEKYLTRVQEGLKAVLDWGYGKNYMGNSPNPAGKTGTSESFLDTNGDGVIDTETLTNTFVGYAPFDNPVMSIVVVSPNLVNPNSKTSARSYANHRIGRLISNKFFEIYNNY